MNKLLETLVGNVAPRFHAEALAVHSLPWGSAVDARSWLRPVLAVSRMVEGMFARCERDVDESHAGSASSLQDTECRQADARMSALMAQTRMF